MQRFNERHFDAFEIQDLETRMQVIKYLIKPKLKILGKQIQPLLSSELGEEFFTHVAQHRRRRVHPPDDTWVAWSTAPNAYKGLPHFRLGMTKDFVYLQCGVMSEYNDKKKLAVLIEEGWENLKPTIPLDYLWTFREGFDFTVHLSLVEDGKTLQKAVEDLRTVNVSEFVCGVILDRRICESDEECNLTARTGEVFRNLYPLYKFITKAPLH